MTPAIARATSGCRSLSPRRRPSPSCPADRLEGVPLLALSVIIGLARCFAPAVLPPG